MSQGICSEVNPNSILVSNIPGAVSVLRANQTDDRQGTDYWISLQNGKRLSVDIKVRAKDCITYGKDDLALETWSVKEHSKIGWTRDSEKQTDYILWIWTDTGRWCLVPFHLLCASFNRRWGKWIAEYGTKEQATTGKYGEIRWHSECVFVPRREVWAAIYQDFSGVVRKPDERSNSTGFQKSATLTTTKFMKRQEYQNRT